MPENDDPFQPWNDPMFKDDPFAPHNDPLNDPFEAWNSPFGKWEDLSQRDREYYRRGY